MSQLALLFALLSSACIPAFSESRDLAFEAKSALWMLEYKQYDEALKAGNYDAAEKIVRTIIADRINYNLDLSRERSSLAHIYEQNGKDEQAEALFKINIKTRQGQDGEKGYTLIYPLNEYADFLDKKGRKDEAKSLRDRAEAIEKSANEEGQAAQKKSSSKKKANSRRTDK